MKLPESVQQIADVIGRDLALTLVGLAKTYKYRDPRYPNAWKFNRRIRVPRRMDRAAWLRRTIGEQATVKLIDAFGGETLHVAGCAMILAEERRRSVVTLLGQNLPVKIIAEWCGISERRVRMIRAEVPHLEGKTAKAA